MSFYPPFHPPFCHLFTQTSLMVGNLLPLPHPFCLWYVVWVLNSQKEGLHVSKKLLLSLFDSKFSFHFHFPCDLLIAPSVVLSVILNSTYEIIKMNKVCSAFKWWFYISRSCLSNANQRIDKWMGSEMMPGRKLMIV